jgi:two-component system LytT family response regulator
MKVIIIEDEFGASQNLIAVLRELEPQCEILAVLESVADTVRWIKNNPPPDLAFIDIQLSDEIAFNIFKKSEVKFPVIFTTAHDDYAIRAFKVNSIDYILKPINKKSVRFAINKYKELNKKHNSLKEEKIFKLLHEMKTTQEKRYKRSFLVHYKDRLLPKEVSDFAYFFIENDIVYGTTRDKQKYILNQKLENIEHQVDPDHFLRVNRQFIISRKAIKEVNLYFNGRFSLKVVPASPSPIIISKAKSSALKKWLED